MAPHTTLTFEESIFEMHKNQSTGLVNIGHFLSVSLLTLREGIMNSNSDHLKVVEKTGVRRTDTRLSGLMTKLAKYHQTHGKENTTIENLDLDKNTFSR